MAMHIVHLIRRVASDEWVEPVGSSRSASRVVESKLESKTGGKRRWKMLEGFMAGELEGEV